MAVLHNNAERRLLPVGLHELGERGAHCCWDRREEPAATVLTLVAHISPHLRPSRGERRQRDVRHGVKHPAVMRRADLGHYAHHQKSGRMGGEAVVVRCT
jgi:hypothetical protein